MEHPPRSLVEASMTHLDFGHMNCFVGAESTRLGLTLNNISANETIRVSLLTQSLFGDDVPLQLSLSEVVEKDKTKPSSSSSKALQKAASSSAKIEEKIKGSQKTERRTFVDLAPLGSITLSAALVVLPDPNATFVHSSSYHVRGSARVCYEVVSSVSDKEISSTPAINDTLHTRPNKDVECGEAGRPRNASDADEAQPMDDLATESQKVPPSLPLTFSATLRTSLLFLDTKELNFNDCIVGQYSVQEIMVWNRSESQLQFSFQQINEREGKESKTQPIAAEIKFWDGDTGKEIPPNQVVSVPSFAPKLLIVKAFPKSLGSFKPRIEFKNKNNAQNTAVLDIQGTVVKDRKLYLENLVIQEADSGLEWHCSNSTLPLDLGAFACGKVKVKKFWFVNNNANELRINLRIPATEEGKEVKIFCEGEESRPNTLTPLGDELEIETPKTEAVKKPLKPPKSSESSAAAMLSGSTFPESEVAFCAAMAASGGKDSTWATRSVSKFCGQWFGSEYLDWELSGARSYELMSEFGKDYCEPLSEFRPFQDLFVANKSSRSDSAAPAVVADSADAVALAVKASESSKTTTAALPSQQSSSALSVLAESLLSDEHGELSLKTRLAQRVSVSIPAHDRKLLVLQVTSSEQLHHIAGKSKHELLERQCTIAIHHSDEDDASAKVELSYASCVSQVSLTPTSYNVGLCNIGEAYPFTVILTNSSALPALLTPSCSATQRELQVVPITVDAFEAKEVTLVLEPTVENHDYRNTIAFENADNPSNVVALEVLANIVDAQHTQIHDLFYKILDSESHYQSQLQFGKMLANMANVTSFRIKNTTQEPLKVEFLAHPASSLAVVALEKTNRVGGGGNAGASSLVGTSAAALTAAAMPANALSAGGGVGGGGSGGVGVGVGDSLSSVLTVESRRSFDDAAPLERERSASRVVDLEDLKWGQRKKSLSRPSDDTDTRLRSASSARFVVPGEISQSLNALDVLPSTAFSKIALRGVVGVDSAADLATSTVAALGGGGAASVGVSSTSSSVFSPSTAPATSSSSSTTTLSTSTSAVDLAAEALKLLQTHIVPWVFDEESPGAEQEKQQWPTQQAKLVDSVQSCYASIDALMSNNASLTRSCKTSSAPSPVPLPQPLPLLEETEIERKSEREGENENESESDAESVGSLEVCCCTVIPADASVKVLVVWKPVALEDALISDIAASAQCREHITIRLPDVTRETLQRVLAQKTSALDGERTPLEDLLAYHRQDAFSLTPRSLLVRGECFRSEMTIVQRNINFGRVVVGDVSKQSVTIINRSPVACMYAFSKSGNISSGFVSFVNGRKGFILPFSTKTVEISFKPTMSCTFEEEFQIKNLLNPADEHTLVIKAKVSRAESFALTVVDEPLSTPSVAPLSLSARALGLAEYDSAAVDIVSLANDALQRLVENVALVSSTSTLAGESSAASAATMSTASTSKSKAKLFLVAGCSAVGRNPTLVVKLKLRNPTNKRKQFVLDASSKDAITLLDKALLRKYFPSIAAPATPSVEQKEKEKEKEKSTKTSVSFALAAAEPSNATEKEKDKEKDEKKSDNASEKEKEKEKEKVNEKDKEKEKDEKSSAASEKAEKKEKEKEKVKDEKKSSTASEKEKEKEKDEKKSKKDKKDKLKKADGEGERVLERLIDVNAQFVVPIPEYLENVLISRCIFSSEVIKSSSSAENVDEDVVQALMDNLEKFQQKLKIAIRKQKADKILKYQKKIAETIKKLSGEESSASNAPPVLVSAAEEEKTQQQQPMPQEKATHENTACAVQPLDEVESNQYLWLEAEEERFVTLKISYLPGPFYKSWRGILPFLGKIRVFEVKNEDVVKTISLGLNLFSSVAAMESPPSLSASLGDALLVAPAPPRALASAVGAAGSGSGNTVNREFLVIIPQWCSFPTKQVYPKYKTLSQGTLGACVKLSRTSKDRNFTGKFTISSIFPKLGEVCVALDAELEQTATDFKAFDAKTFGELQLVTTAADEGAGAGGVAFSDTDDRFLKSWGTERPQFDRKSVTHSLVKNEFVFLLKPGNFRDFSLVWSPPMFLLNSSEEFRLIGALKLHFQSGACTRLLTLPFICVYQHNSVVKVEKYHTLEKAPVGSFQLYDVEIHNDSAKSSLNYHVFLEKLAEKYSSRGSLEIIQGKTGRIPPQQSRFIKLRFYGTSAGRFEQKMWVQNANDSFDQGRIVFYANVVVSQTMFVTFPDLSYSAETGRYAAIDFGRLQIRSTCSSCNNTVNVNTNANTVTTGGEEGADWLRGFDSSMQKRSESSAYALRVRNVSPADLAVIAVPNLRNQCFVYADKHCRDLAVNVSIAAGCERVFYIVLKPADVDNKAKRHHLGSAAAAGGGGGDAEHGNASFGGNFAALSEPSATAANAVRELNGGIRFLFFSHAVQQQQQEQPEAAEPPVVPAAAAAHSDALFGRKLFETALSFKALVGKSILSASLSESCDGINVVDARCAAGRRYQGELRIANLSETFSLHYAFSDDPCVFFQDDVAAWKSCAAAESEASLENSGQSGSNAAPAAVKLLFAADKCGMLEPRSNRVVRFEIAVSPSLRGFLTKSIRLCNLDTNEVVELCLALFVEAHKLSLRGVAPGERQRKRVIALESAARSVCAGEGEGAKESESEQDTVAAEEKKKEPEKEKVAKTQEETETDKVQEEKNETEKKEKESGEVTVREKEKEEEKEKENERENEKDKEDNEEPKNENEREKESGEVTADKDKNTAMTSLADCAFSRPAEYRAAGLFWVRNQQAYWSTRGTGGAAPSGLLVPRLSSLEVVRSHARAAVCTLSLRNESAATLTLLPMSDLPLAVEVEEEREKGEGDGDEEKGVGEGIDEKHNKGETPETDEDIDVQGKDGESVKTASSATTALSKPRLAPASSLSANERESVSLSTSSRVRRRFKKCGEAFSIKPHTSVVVRVLKGVGTLPGEAAFTVDMRQASRGKIFSLQGYVYFVERINALQSIFVRPTLPSSALGSAVSTPSLPGVDTVGVGPSNTLTVSVNPTAPTAVMSSMSTVTGAVTATVLSGTGGETPVSTLPTPPSLTPSTSTPSTSTPSTPFTGSEYAITTSSDHALPVVQIVQIDCAYLLPKFRVTPTEVDLGRTRLQSAQSFEFCVKNLSEQDTLCLVDGVPPWMRIEPALPSLSSDTRAEGVGQGVGQQGVGKHLQWVRSACGSRVLFVCKEGVAYAWKALISSMPDIAVSGVDLTVTALPLAADTQLDKTLCRADLDTLHLNPLRVGVKFKIDRRSALEVAAISSETLTPLPHDTQHPHTIPQGTLFQYRFLRSFVVPPVYTVEVNEPVRELVGAYAKFAVHCGVDESVVKQGCKLAVKNIFDTPLRVSLSFEPFHAELSEILDISCKFEQQTSASTPWVELLPEESAQVRLRAVPRANKTLSRAALAAISEFSLRDLPGDKRPALTLSTLLSEGVGGGGVVQSEGLANALLKLRSGFCKLGEIVLRPALSSPPPPVPPTPSPSPPVSTVSAYSTTDLVSGVVGAESTNAISASTPPIPTTAIAVSEKEREREKERKPSLLLTDSDGIRIEVVGAVKLGPTTRLLSIYDPTALSDAGLVVDFVCDAEKEREKKGESEKERKGETVKESEKVEESERECDGGEKSETENDKNNDTEKNTEEEKEKEKIAERERVLGPALLELQSGWQERVFYVANPTSSPIRFKTSSASHRFPGAAFRFESDVDVDVDTVVNTGGEREDEIGRERRVAWSSDTIRLHAEPSEGVVPVGTALRVALRIAPGDPAHALLSHDKLAGRELHSHTHAAGESERVAEQLLGCLPLEIWDVDSPLHPPSLVFAHVLTRHRVAPLRSLPISDVAKRKSSLDREIFRALLLDSDTCKSTPGFNSPTLGVAVLNSSTPGVTVLNSRVSVSNNLSPGVEIFDDTFYTREGEKEGHSVPWSLRGVSPHITLSSLSSIDLGRQLQRPEHVEWFAALRNHTRRALCVELHVYASGTPSERGSWLRLGQSHAVLAPHGASSLALYFNRAVAGHFCGFVIFRGVGHTHVVRATLRVLADDRRAKRIECARPAMTSSSATPSSLSLLSTTRLSAAAQCADRVALQWMTDHLSLRFTLCDEKLFACAPCGRAAQVFVLRAFNQQAFRSQSLEIGTISLRNKTSLSLELQWSTSVKWINASVRVNDDPRESKLPLSLVLPPEGALDIKIAMNPSSYKAAMVRSGVESESLVLHSNADNAAVEARVVGLVVCVCKTLDNLTANIPLHELAK